MALPLAERDWLHALGAGSDADYRTGERTGMEKYKRMRTADCVVGGFRFASAGKVVGSLLLGLYDGAGRLDHVGFTVTLEAAKRTALFPAAA